MDYFQNGWKKPTQLQIVPFIGYNKIMFKFIYALILIVVSCKNDGGLSDKTIGFESLFGKIISCSYKEINTKLFFYSPHLIGVPIKEDGYEFEYFHSVGSKKESNSIYFESSFMGKSNFQTKQSLKNKKTRRIKMTIEKQKLFITAINEIDDKMIPVNPVLYKCQALQAISYN